MRERDGRMRYGVLRAWVSLSRLPFYTAGILPFLLGNLLAWDITGHLSWSVLGWGVLGLLLILLATHFSAEYFDYEVDALAARSGRNRFSGGSQVLQTGIIPRRHALIASFVSLSLAAGVGMLLQFYYKTGPFTLPLGVLGVIGGLFYAAKPIQWAYRSLGEIWIGFCYGWLTLAASYYIQTGGAIPALVHWVALPIALSIFNVILINEFPDYWADRESGKLTLVARFGKAKMSKLYALISLGVWGSYIFAVKMGVPVKALLFFSPVFILSAATAFQVLRGGYTDRERLERICAKTLIVNLGVTISLMLAVLVY